MKHDRRVGTKHAFALGAALVIAAHPALAGADEAATQPDQVRPSDDAWRHAIDRTWLYLDDAKVASPGVVVGMTSLAFTGVGSDPNRVYAPFAFNTGQPGWLTSLGGEVGLLPRLSVMALGQLGIGGSESRAGTKAGAIVGIRFQLSPDSWRTLHLVASGGYLREAWAQTSPSGDDGVWAETALAAELRALRFGVTAHGERVFANGRDKVDVMVKAGASYRVVGGFRLGAEWVGQDLEETFADQAEGGARQFVGPTASLQLLSDRLTVVGGPSLGLSDHSPKVLGRIALAYGF
ncbi:MAG: hypothetical protein M3O36_17225 [Myxococcota bacterium]|nr:hypothetical protein [Myxococcota bacterium]